MKKLIRKWLGMEPVPESGLRPGDCECGHSRCVHERGIGRCGVQYHPDGECDAWTICACQIYIRDNDSDDGDDDPTPTPAELERMYQQ